MSVCGVSSRSQHRCHVIIKASAAEEPGLLSHTIRSLSPGTPMRRDAAVSMAARAHCASGGRVPAGCLCGLTETNEAT